MIAADCLRDPADPLMPYSVVIDGGQAEDVYAADGTRLGRAVIDRGWHAPRRGAGAAAIYGVEWQPNDGTPELAVLKKLALGGTVAPATDRAGERWARELAAYDSTRQLSADGHSYVEQFDQALAATGMPGRVPRLLGMWVERGDAEGGDRLVLCLRRVPGTPLYQLVKASHPKGLPPALAADVVGQLARALTAAHRLGLSLGDLNTASPVIDILENKATVGIVDHEYLDVLRPEPEDLARWAAQVDEEWQYRLHAERLSYEVAFAEVPPTVMRMAKHFGLDTDLATLGIVARFAVTGSADPKDPPPKRLPSPLVWFLHRASGSFAVLRDRRDGAAAEVASAAVIGQWVTVLLRYEGESELDYARRLESSWDLSVPNVVAACWQFARRAADPKVRLVAARWAMTVLPHVPPPYPDAYAHVAESTLASVCAEVPDDGAFRAAVAAAGLGPSGGNTVLADIARRMSPTVYTSALTRLWALWPELFAEPLLPAPPTASEPVPFGSDTWLEQVLVHAGSRPLPAAVATDGPYRLEFSDRSDDGFLFEVERSRLVRVARGITAPGATTTVCSWADLADVADGTASFNAVPGKRSGESALWAWSTVAPTPEVVRGFTNSWPDRTVWTTPVPPFTRRWFEQLEAVGARRPSAPGVSPCSVAFRVTDDESADFTVTVSATGRVGRVTRGVSGRRVVSLRRNVLLDLLLRPDTLARLGTAAVAVVAKILPDIRAFTLTGLRGAPFWSPKWFRTFATEAVSTSAPSLHDGAWVLALAEDQRVTVGVAVDGGDVRFRLHDVDGEPICVSLARLWDILVERRPWPSSKMPEPVAALVAVTPPTIRSFTTPSTIARVPPGEYAALAQKRREAEIHARGAAFLRGVLSPTAAQARHAVAARQELVQRAFGGLAAFEAQALSHVEHSRAFADRALQMMVDLDDDGEGYGGRSRWTQDPTG